MKPIVWVSFWILFASPLLASPWSFEPPLEITSTVGPKIFHHLESSGRNNIAVSEKTIAVVWEDERDGVPRIYLARKGFDEPRFKQEIVISGEGEAYEPSITALSGDRFALVWEEDETIMTRIVGPGKQGRTIAMPGNGAQGHAVTAEDHLYILAVDSTGRYNRILLYRNKISSPTELIMLDSCPVDDMAPKDDQLYPAGAMLNGQILAAWEDRRPGHTIIMSARQKNRKGCEFHSPMRLSLRPEGRPNLPYGKGHGVARVALADFGDNQVMAAWADKRDFREGYDIYAAAHELDGKFGANIRVQDDFGGQARQWHTAIAGHAAGHVVVAWDDDREDNVDVMLSWMESNEWSDDIPLSVGSGPGEQSHPSLAFDSAGNLHIAWVERATPGGPTRLRYSLGRAQKAAQKTE